MFYGSFLINNWQIEIFQIKCYHNMAKDFASIKSIKMIDTRVADVG